MKGIPWQLARSIIALAMALLPADGPAQCVVPATGLVSWWRGEGDGIDRASANHGAVGGGLGFAAGQVGQAFSFTADGQVVTVPASASLNVGAGSGMTVEGWINPAQATTQLPLVEWNSGAGPGAHFWTSVSFAGFGGPGSLYASLHGGVNGIFATGPGVIQAGVWQHVAMTYDPASGLARLYRNGAQVSSANLGTQTPLTTANLNLGARPGGPFFRGRLDEFAVYSRALLGSEIQAIYNGGTAGKCLSPATLIVTSLADNGAGSLRALIAQSIPGDTIGFAADGTITLTSAELLINKSLNILGPDPRSLAISGAGARRVFNITAGAVTIAGLTIQDGLVRGATPGSSGLGGGILNSGTLLVSNCFLLGNLAIGANGAGGTAGNISGAPGGTAFGGGIWNQGTLTITRCTFRGNGAQGGNGGDGIANSPFGGGGGDGGLARGGAIYDSSNVTVINSTFTGNLIYGGSGGTGGAGSSGPLSGPGGIGGLAEGGAVFNALAGASRFVHATLFNNIAQGGLGGNSGAATPQRSASGLSIGGGLFSVTANTFALNTLVAGNQILPGHPQSRGPDVSGPFTSQGHNLIGVTNDSTGWTGTDLVGSVAAPRNPVLGPLGDNGGSTPTFAPQPNSPAVDAGDDATLSPPYALATDQRGFARREGSQVDIGAVELNVARLTAVSYPRAWLLTNVPGSDTFLAEAAVTVYSAGGASTVVTVTYELQDETNGLVPLRSNVVSQVVSSAGTVTLSLPLALAPVAPLDSVNHTYSVVASLTHRIGNGPLVADNTLVGTTNRFLYFTGRLFFGPRLLRIAAFGNAPSAVTPAPPSHVSLTLQQPRLVSAFVPEFDFIPPAIGGVHLHPNGDAFLSSAGFFVQTISTVPPGAVANVGFLRTSFNFTSSGISANSLTVKLPAGFGYNVGNTTEPSGRILRSTLLVPGTPELDDSLRPILPSFSFGPPGGSRFYFSEETKPVWIPSDSITWHVNEGRFELLPIAGPRPYVRQVEFTTLANTSPVTDSDSLYKRSNDRYYEETTGDDSPITLRAGASGEALLSANFAFGPRTFFTHFPYNNSVTWSGGYLVVSNDLIAPGSTGRVAGVRLDYARDCLETGPCPILPNGLDQLEVTANGGRLHVTKDGGLTGEVTLFNANELEWGSRGQNQFAHRHTDSFESAAYHLPGTFLRGDQTGVGETLRPGVLLLSGFGSPDSPAYEERPETAAYVNAGLANYAGLNFRVGETGMQASSLLGGSLVEYPLTPRSKYYARYGGISGIHEPASFPGVLVIYGYPFTFTSFGVSFLDNDVEDSLIDGSLYLKYPSGFTQEFSRMTLTCQGDLDSGEVPPNGPFKDLLYWNGKFRTLALSFEASTNCVGGTNNTYLALGVQTYASHIPQPLFGTLGFKADGNLVTPAQSVPGVDSRLVLPANITLRRSDTDAYQLTTVGKGYFNNHDGQPDPEGSGSHGWFNIAGKMNLPFFEDARVHLHTQARSNDNHSSVFVMGGWRAKDRPDLDTFGWHEGGRHFFTNLTELDRFDTNNHGFPVFDPGVNNVTAYREGGEHYRPRAQQSWLGSGLIKFDYPLTWSKSLRTFSSFQSQPQDLAVLTLESQVKRMTPRNAEITFGAEYSGLPKINLAGMALDVVNDATGVLKSLERAAGDAATAALNAGLNGLDSLLKDRIDELLREVMFSPIAGQPTFEEMVNALYAAAAAEASVGGSGGPSSDGGGLPEAIDEIIREQLIARLASLVEGSPTGPLLQKIRTVLTDVDAALGTVIRIARREPNGQRLLARNLVTELVKNDAAQFAALVADVEFLNKALESAGPTLDDIITRAQDIQKRVRDLQQELDGAWKQELAALISQYTGPFASRVEEKILRYLQENPLPSVPQFRPGPGLARLPQASVSEEKFKAFVRQTLIDELAATPISAGLQAAIKQRLQDLNGTIRETIDAYFQQINGVIRDALSSALAEVDNTINSFAGDLASKLGSGKIQGYAALNDDGLRKLRLDGEFRMSAPEPMEFAGWLEFEQLDSKGTPGCKYDGKTNVCEIRLGADNIPISWGTEKARLKLCAKFTADEKIRGFAGCLELRGKLKFEVVEVTELLALVAFGKDEGYFGARCRANLGDFEVAGGLWFGQACGIDPIRLIDKDVAAVVPQPYEKIVGGYAYAEGWVPVNQWIGIPSSCLLDIKAGIGAGIFYFESGNPVVRTYGGKMLLGVDVDLLCIANAHGEIRLVGAKAGDEFKLYGVGDFSLEIGSCPFCLEFSKSVGLHYGSRAGWDVDF